VVAATVIAMSTLLALLQDVDPAMTPSLASDLRAGLVAINQQAQAEPASEEWSLNRWWQWLDDEGYDREALLLPLQRFCAARIGAPALAQLAQDCHAMGHEPGGLRLLLDLLEAQDADLPEQLHRLEVQAQAEANELSLIAGGTSTAFKDVGFTALGVGSVYVIYRTCFKKKNRTDVAPSGLDMIGHQVHKTEEALVQDLNVAANDASDLEFQLREAILKDPESALARIKVEGPMVYENLKRVSGYSEKDVERRAAVLTAQHVREFLLNQDEQLILEHIRKSPGYDRKVKEIAMADPEWSEGIEHANLREILDRSRKALESGEWDDWFARNLEQLTNSDFKITLREGMIDKVYNAYKFMVSQEVKAAKEAEASLRDDISITAVYGEAEDDFLFCKQEVMAGIVQVSDEAKAAARGAIDEADGAFVDIL